MLQKMILKVNNEIKDENGDSESLKDLRIQVDENTKKANGNIIETQLI